MIQLRNAYEASEMADAAMVTAFAEGITNGEVWDMCYLAFEMGASEEDVDKILKNLKLNPWHSVVDALLTIRRNNRPEFTRK